MKNALAVVAAAALFVSCAQMRGGGDWVTLLDGDQGLENWNQVGGANWHTESGAIVADHGKPGFLVSKQSYADFQIRAEFWAASDTNSGIFIRCADPAKIGGQTCYEVNIWNVYEITARGSEMSVKLNGVQTAVGRDGKHASGPFALQYGPGLEDAESGPIKWRKVQIRPL